MDMAFEHYNNVRGILDLFEQIPPQHRSADASLTTLGRIGASVRAMSEKLAAQSEEIARLQLANADLAHASKKHEPTPADCIESLAELVEADTSIEICDGAVWVHYNGRRHQASADDALDLLDAAGLLAQAVRS